MYDGIQNISGFAMVLPEDWELGADGMAYYVPDLGIDSSNNITSKVGFEISEVDKSIYDSKGHRFDLDVEVLAEAIQANPDKVLTDAWQSKS